MKGRGPSEPLLAVGFSVVGLGLWEAKRKEKQQQDTFPVRNLYAKGISNHHVAEVTVGRWQQQNGSKRWGTTRTARNVARSVSWKKKKKGPAIPTISERLSCLYRSFNRLNVPMYSLSRQCISASMAILSVNRH